MKAQPLRLALAGLGSQGREHLGLAGPYRDAGRFTAAYDPGEAAPELPDGCARFRDEAEFFTRLPGLADAVILATPPEAYNSLIPRILGAGLHIMAEKPLGLSVLDARRYMAIARRKQRVLMATAQRKFHASYLRIPAMLAKMGAVKEVLVRLELDKKPRGWRKETGCLVDLGFHGIELVRQCFGDLRVASAVLFDEDGRFCRNQRDDEGHVLFQTENGIFVRLCVLRSSDAKSEFFRAVSPTHTLTVTRDQCELREGGALVETHASRRDWEDAMTRQMEAFAECCAHPSEEKWLDDNPAALVTMKLIEEIYARCATA